MAHSHCVAHHWESVIWHVVTAMVRDTVMMTSHHANTSHGFGRSDGDEQAENEELHVEIFGNFVSGLETQNNLLEQLVKLKVRLELNLRVN